MDHKKIGIFITGGIAAYKIPQLIRDLKRDGHEVRVAMTAGAKDFVTPLTLATVSKHSVFMDDGNADSPVHVEHVEFAHWMDIAVVVPATANTIAKLAAGLADNIVTTTLLAFNGPKLIVPAMNDQMWLNQQTQLNIQHLSNLGATILPPETGMLAEGYAAVGRLPELAIIELFINTFQITKPLTGKRVLISAGGTSEEIDPVRYLTNKSSGRMGVALANAAAALGASVTLISTKKHPLLPTIKEIRVSTANEMSTEITKEFNAQDIVIMAAAVSDFRPEKSSAGKIKKQDSTAVLDLHLVQNPDILASLGQNKSNQYLVGFAAETDNLLKNARTKLQKKNANLIVANDVKPGHGFDQATNQVTLITSTTEVTFGEQDKLNLSFAIFDFINNELANF